MLIYHGKKQFKHVFLKFKANLLLNSFNTKGCWIPRQQHGWDKSPFPLQKMEMLYNCSFLFFLFLFFYFWWEKQHLNSFPTFWGGLQWSSANCDLPQHGGEIWWSWSSFLICKEPFAKQYLCFQGTQMHSYLKKQIHFFSLPFPPETMAVALFSQPINK